MSWMNKDGLYLQYGTEKAVPTTGGEFRMPGELRTVDIVLDLTKLTSTPSIADNAQTTFFPAGMFIEQVELVTDVAATGGTSLSVGLLDYDRSTVISNTAFVNGALTATMTPAGTKTVLTQGSTGAGAYIGTVTAKAGYVSALVAGTFTAGKITVRVKYRGTTPITH